MAITHRGKVVDFEGESLGEPTFRNHFGKALTQRFKFFGTRWVECPAMQVSGFKLVGKSQQYFVQDFVLCRGWFHRILYSGADFECSTGSQSGIRRHSSREQLPVLSVDQDATLYQSEHRHKFSDGFPFDGLNFASFFVTHTL